MARATRRAGRPIVIVQYHLGLVSLKAGDKQGARNALTAAINSPASFAEKNQARKALADIQ